MSAQERSKWWALIRNDSWLANSHGAFSFTLLRKKINNKPGCFVHEEQSS